MPLALRNFKHRGASALLEALVRKVYPKGFKGTCHTADASTRPFRLNDAPELFNPERNRSFQQGSIEGFCLTDAVVWPAAGAVATATGNLINEAFFDENVRNAALRYGACGAFPFIRADADHVATLGHFYQNYFHRHVDSIPRVHALWHPYLRAIDRITLLVDKRFAPDEIELIRALIPTNVHLQMVTTELCRIRAKCYIHLPFLSRRRTTEFRWWVNCAGYLPQEYLEFLRNRVRAKYALDWKSGEGRKIYVTRRGATVRRLKNEVAVVSYLEALGFECVVLEGMPLPEQMRLFASIDVLVAQHGAALTNLLYAKPSLRVVEILSNARCQIYESLATALGLTYQPVICDGINKNDDVTVPLDLLAAAIGSLA